MRKEMTTIEAMQLVNIEGEGLEKFREMLSRMRDDALRKGVQLRSMNAEKLGNNRTLKSYRTLVAYYDGEHVIELGVYSRSTSKQVTKWAEELGVDIIRLKDAKRYF